MADPFAPHRADLAALAARARLRTLRRREGADFASNDYLALANDARMKRAIAEAIDRGVPAGSGGSRLLRGNHAEHEALEEEAARFFGSEAALWFSSGFAANSALLATLPRKGDLIVYDRLIHASAHEGMRLSRADRAVADHNDAQAFEDAVARWRSRGGTGQVWIVVESLYSMDGDHAPLDDLAALADDLEAVLLIDEAHATGVFGPGGRGLAADLEGKANVVTLRTCGKALGTEGALVCGPRVVRDYLVNRARGFIFSTAPSPLMAAATRESLRICAQEPQRREALFALVAHAEMALAGLGVEPTGSQIIPVVLGDDAPAMAAAAALQEAGFDVRGIRPPTVPVGTSRLRISLNLNVTADDVTAMAERLGQVIA